MEDIDVYGTPSKKYNEHSWKLIDVKKYGQRFPDVMQQHRGDKRAFAKTIVSMKLASERERKRQCIARKLDFFSFAPMNALEHIDLWLLDEFGGVPLATQDEINLSFGENLKELQVYTSAEHATPPNKFGGGVCYLVARAFQRTRLINRDKMPSFPESFWQMQAYLQYCSMTDKQRYLQGFLYHGLGKTNELLKMTQVVRYREMTQIFGSSGLHAIGRNIPIPPVQNLSGVAYVSPIDILRYAFAHGLNLAESFVQCGIGKKKSPPPSKVRHLTECKALREFRDDVLDKCPHHGTVLVPWCTMWQDGFPGTRTKQNRKSVVVTTFTIGTPCDKVNSLDNTFLLGLGMKENSTGWTKLQEQVRKDLVAASNPSQPLLVYHGRLKKMVPVCLKLIAEMEDKVERGDATSTLSFASDYHRCFGLSVKLETPVLHRDDIRSHKASMLDGEHLLRPNYTHPNWTWPHIDHDATNGGRIGSCVICRNARIGELMGYDTEFLRCSDSESDNDDLPSHLPRICCANWSLRSPLLSWPVPEDFPKSTDPNCPVPPPRGREPGREYLYPIELTFEYMIQACKFAFFHCSKHGRGSGNWTKKVCECYLRTCGVATKFQARVYQAATKHRTSNHDDVDYTEGVTEIGDLRFPAPWTAREKLGSHIEMIMHMVFLGAAESNASLVDKWLLRSNLGGINTFRKDMQPLLQEIQRFHLSWCPAHPFNGKESNLGLGSWVSENWLAQVRLSKVMYAWFWRKGNNANIKSGGQDVSRMVTSFLAMVARLMAHTGVDENSIHEFEQYRKEFMSSLMELDIQLNFETIRPIPPGTKDRAKESAKATPWWFKSNYISLESVGKMMSEYGPLINLWDGGGKGEKFITLVKPLIPRGIRDSPGFFINISQRVYKNDFTNKLQCLSKRYRDENCDDCSSACSSGYVYNLERDGYDSDWSDLKHGPVEITGMDQLPTPMDSAQNDEMDSLSEESEYVDEEEINTPSLEGQKRAAVNTEDEQGAGDGTTTSSAAKSDHTREEREYLDRDLEWQKQMMEKPRVIYTYKKFELIGQALAAVRPLSGVIVNHNGKSMFMVVNRLPPKSYEWHVLSFSDTNGLSVNGSWYAPIAMCEAIQNPLGREVSYEEVVQQSEMAALAIPLRYALGEKSEHKNCYCVITNWWKERVRNGGYELPKLDPLLYGFGMSTL